MRRKIQYDSEKGNMVFALSQYGVPLEDIAATIGICKDVMVRLYEHEIAKGRAIANTKIGKRLFEKCMEGETSALIFWAKCRMGWRAEDSKVADTEYVSPTSVKIKVINGRKNKNGF